MANSIYDGVQHVVQVDSNTGGRCKICNASFCGSDEDELSLAEPINHYIKEHGYRLLHVGTETTHSEAGKLWYVTVAVLGK